MHWFSRTAQARPPKREFVPVLSSTYPKTTQRRQTQGKGQRNATRYFQWFQWDLKRALNSGSSGPARSLTRANPVMWRNRHNRPLENKELWRRFLSVRSRVPVRLDIEWNLGKSTPVLKMVDKLAKSAAKSPMKATDIGYRPGKVSRHRTEERGGATLFPARSQELIIRVYAHTVVGKDACKVGFTVFSEKEKKFLQKKVAYVTGHDRGKIHRHRCYQVRFNDNPNYPVLEILEALENCPG